MPGQAYTGEQLLPLLNANEGGHTQSLPGKTCTEQGAFALQFGLKREASE